MGSQELSQVEKEHENVNDTNLNTHGHTKVLLEMWSTKLDVYSF